jgi:hypothetical protein
MCGPAQSLRAATALDGPPGAVLGKIRVYITNSGLNSRTAGSYAWRQAAFVKWGDSRVMTVTLLPGASTAVRATPHRSP